jgi:protein-disulfide isomerase
MALCLAAGCKAQSTPQGPLDPTTSRRIEVMVRSQYSIPQDFNVSIGAREPSSFTGYETLPVTISRGARSEVIKFLISSDGKQLAHLDTFDLSKDPASAIDIAGRPIRGNAAAPVTIVNFDDLECPYCSQMHEQLLQIALGRYKDKVRLIYRDNPLAEIHPWAIRASVDANCLAAQNGGVYWAYVDYVHAHGQEISGPDRNPAKSYEALDKIARQQATVGKLDSAKLDACLAAQDEASVRASKKEAEQMGLDGTPVLFVNGERINGAVPEERINAAIDRALKSLGQQPPAAPAGK